MREMSRHYDGYSPIPGAGENGSPVLLPSFTKERQAFFHQINRFNILASDRISVDRSLPDVRPQSCPRSHPTLRSTVCIVMVFHNEAWSTLIRSVHSIMARSPLHLLSQVILVDDASDRTYLIDGRLQNHLDTFNRNNTMKTNIRLIREESRVGLVRARLTGASACANEDILMFLDAHIECTDGWMQPLIETIEEHGNNPVIVCPVIDVIQEQTFAFARSFHQHVGGINWNLHYRWFPSFRSITKENEAFPTPVMAGGLFAIRRDVFWSMGSYDSGTRIWGGENIELSLRMWTCSNASSTNAVLIHPCSHVAHLFRSSSPYSFRSGGNNNSTTTEEQDSVTSVLNSNLARVVDVWMDEYAPFFRAMNPLLVQHAPSVQDMRERVELRRSLNCRPFSWFLEKVVGPGHFFPDTSGQKNLVQIRSSSTGLCLEQEQGSSSNRKNRLLTLQRCSIELFQPQLFVHDAHNSILMADELLCVDVSTSSKNRKLFMNACHPGNFLNSSKRTTRQSFSVDSNHEMKRRRRKKKNAVTIRHSASGECVSVEPNSRKLLSLSPCSINEKDQTFSIKKMFSF